nr:MAG TPA_asm: hypothetical protein [Caudoviricetes sp.]
MASRSSIAGRSSLRSQRFHCWFPSQKYNISLKIYTRKYNFSRKLYNRLKK